MTTSTPIQGASPNLTQIRKLFSGRRIFIQNSPGIYFNVKRSSVEQTVKNSKFKGMKFTFTVLYDDHHIWIDYTTFN